MVWLWVLLSLVVAGVFFEVHLVIAEEFFDSKSKQGNKAATQTGIAPNRVNTKKKSLKRRRNVNKSSKQKTPSFLSGSNQKNEKKKQKRPSAVSSIKDLSAFKNNLENLYGGNKQGSSKPEREPVKVSKLNSDAKNTQTKLDALFAGPRQPQPSKQNGSASKTPGKLQKVELDLSPAKSSSGNQSLSKYERMLKSGLPEGAILHAMKSDGIKNPNMSMLKAKPKKAQNLDASLKKQAKSSNSKPRKRGSSGSNSKPRKRGSSADSNKSSSGFFSWFSGSSGKRKSKSRGKKKASTGPKLPAPHSKPAPAPTGNPLLDELNNKLSTRRI